MENYEKRFSIPELTKNQKLEQNWYTFWSATGFVSNENIDEKQLMEQ